MADWYEQRRDQPKGGKCKGSKKGFSKNAYPAKGFSKDSQQMIDLKLSALSDFAAVNGICQECPLVDIGANTCCVRSLNQTSALAATLLRAAAARVSHLVLTGVNVERTQLVARMCDDWSGTDGLQKATAVLGNDATDDIRTLGIESLPILSFTAGFHPNYLEGKRGGEPVNSGSIEVVRKLAAHTRCAAIGEIGLDYFRNPDTWRLQKEWCEKQVKLAVELGKPLFMHDRDSKKGDGSREDLLNIVKDSGIEPSRVCVHCFTGSDDDLKAYVAYGCYIGITGFVAKEDRGKVLRDYLSKGLLPLNQLMIETDCPYMLPDGLPATLGLKENTAEPCVMPVVCRVVAECLGKNPREVAQVTTTNALRFFFSAPGEPPCTAPPAVTVLPSLATPGEQTAKKAKNGKNRRWQKTDARNAPEHDVTMVPAGDTDGETALAATRGQPEPTRGPGYDMTPQKLKARWSQMGPSDVFEFYGHGAKAGKFAMFSNFYDQSRRPFDFEVPVAFCACELTASERVVCCEFSEKAIMLCKAAAMGDRRSYDLISASRQPSAAKALGRTVAGFDDSLWSRIVCSVAFEVVHQKFSKAPELQETLLETGDRVIAEATSNDSNWGIGLDMGDPRCQDPKKWKGTNLLGWALMETRDAIR